MLDQKTKNEIMATVNRAIVEALEGVNEKYLTAKELSEQFQMFSPAWVRTYGYLLPRVQAKVVEDGAEHKTGWAYPRNRIARMVMEGKINFDGSAQYRPSKS